MRNDEVMSKETTAAVKLANGYVRVPVRPTPFGDNLDLRNHLPADCDTIMVMVNSGGGLNAGFPQPVGFLKLTHQLYLRDIEKLIELQTEQSNALLWVTIAPVRSAEFFSVWSAFDKDRDPKG